MWARLEAGQNDVTSGASLRSQARRFAFRSISPSIAFAAVTAYPPHGWSGDETRTGRLASTALQTKGRLGPSYRRAIALRGLQVADDVVDCPGDTAGKRRERDNNADRDHRQDNAVLGHRLTLLADVAHAEVKDQILERHGFTPFANWEFWTRMHVEPLVDVDSTRGRATPHD